MNIAMTTLDLALPWFTDVRSKRCERILHFLIIVDKIASDYCIDLITESVRSYFSKSILPSDKQGDCTKNTDHY